MGRVAQPKLAYNTRSTFSTFDLLRVYCFIIFPSEVIEVPFAVPSYKITGFHAVVLQVDLYLTI